MSRTGSRRSSEGHGGITSPSFYAAFGSKLFSGRRSSYTTPKGPIVKALMQGQRPERPAKDGSARQWNFCRPRNPRGAL